MSGPRTPLLRPSRYFAAHDGSPPLAHAATAVAVVALVTAAGLAVLLNEFATALNTTITVDNPAYPGDPFCENPAARETPTPAGCGEPKTVQRDLGALVAERFSWLPLAAFVGVPAFWLFEAVVLHAASGLAGGSGAFRDTLAVAGWGMTPSVLRVAASAGFVVVRLPTLSGSPESAVAGLEAAVAGLGSVGFAAAVVVALWGGVIRTYGLVEARELAFDGAVAVVELLTLLGLLVELI
ncbi:MAG: YIP1 family protein [Halobaculum sp.]